MSAPEPPDRAWLLDATHCPVCRSVLSSARCRSCGSDLAGELGRQFWDNSQRIVALYRERDELVRRARAARTPVPGAQTVVPAAPVPVPVPASVPASAPASVPASVSGPGPAPVASPAAAAATAVTVPPPGTTPPDRPPARLGVQTLLVGLGALLLSVAAIVFLVFSWNRLGLLGRAGVILGFTLLVLLIAALLRRRLPGTGEAVGAFGAVLVLADAWAVRATGLAGADQADAAAYWAGAFAVCALVLAGYGRGTGVRAAGVTAAGLAPLAAFAAGLGSPLAHDPGVAAGFLGAALVALVRPWLPAGWELERIVLRLAAGLGLVAGGWIALLVAVSGGDPLLDRTDSADLGHRVAAALLLGLGAVIAAAQAAADRHGRQLPPAWSALAGASAAAAAVAAAIAGVDASGAVLVWTLVAMPLAAGLLSLLLADRALPRLPVPGLSRPVLSRAATVGWLLATLPAAGVLLLAAAAVAIAGPSGAWTRRGTDALQRGLAGELLSRPDADRIWLTVFGGLAVSAALAWLRTARGRGRRRTLWPPQATLVTGAALLAATLAPRLAIGAVIGLLVLLGLGAVALARRPGPARRALLAVAAAAGLVAVLGSWAVDVLSVPTTLAAALALAWVRRLVTGTAVRAFVLVLAVIAVVPAAGGAAGLLDRPMADRIVAAGCAGALLAVAALTAHLPRRLARAGGPAWARTERLAAAWPGLGALLVAIAVTAAQADWPLHDAGLHRLQVLLIVLLAGTGVSLLAGARTGRVVELVAATVLPPVATATVVLLVRGLLPGLTPAVVGAAAVAGIAVGFAALIHDRLGRPRAPQPPDAPPRRPSGIRECVETGIVVTALFPLLFTPHLPALSLELLLLGAGAVAIAGTPGRSRLGWLAGVLLTASAWVRLGINDVQVVEPYSVPPAVALLWLAVLQLRRDRGLPAWRALARPAAVGLLPSVVAAGINSATRPWLLFALATGFVVVAWRWPEPPPSSRRLRRGRAGVDAALLAFAALTAAGAGVLRPVLAWGDEASLDGVDLGPARIELWCLPAAAIVAAAVAVAHRRGLTGPWRGRGDSLLGPLLAGPLLVAAGPVLLAATLSHQVPRSLAVLGVAGVTAVVTQWARLRFVVGTALVVAAAAALPGPLREGGPPLELWTVPFAAALTAVGALRLAADPARRSWPELGLGLAVGLLPPLLLAADHGGTLRIALLTLGAAAVVVAGALRRLAAPLLLGSAVLALHALIQLAPWLRSVYHALPGWVGLATVGILLLVLGATYERRLQRLRALRLRINALR